MGNLFPECGVKTDINREFKISAFDKLSVITIYQLHEYKMFTLGTFKMFWSSKRCGTIVKPMVGSVPPE